MSIIISQQSRAQKVDVQAETQRGELNRVLSGETFAAPAEVQGLVRQVLNIPPKYSMNLGPVPLIQEDYLTVSIKVGKYSNDYLAINYDGQNIYVNQEFTERRGVPERIAQEEAMFSRINALFEGEKEGGAPTTDLRR